MCPVIVSGIVTGDALVSYWPVFSLLLEIVPDVFGKVNLAQIIIVSNVANSQKCGFNMKD